MLVGIDKNSIFGLSKNLPLLKRNDPLNTFVMILRPTSPLVCDFIRKSHKKQYFLKLRFKYSFFTGLGLGKQKTFNHKTSSVVRQKRKS